MENFKDMLNIYTRLPRERLQDPLVEEEILYFLSDLGHSREIQVFTDVNVKSMHQTWRSFAAIINSDDEQTKYENDDDGSDEKEDVEESAHTQSDEEKFDYEESNDDDESMNNKDDEEVKELYDNANLNLGNTDAEMTDADQGTTEQHVSQEEEDAHTAYAVAVSLSELELKKILMDKMEANKSIERSDTQKTLYNALVTSYNSDKDNIPSYGDVVLLKRGHDDKDKDQDPFARLDRGMKRQRTGKDADSSKDPSSKEKRSTSSSKEASKSRHMSSGKFVPSEEPSHNVEATSTCKSLTKLEYHLEKCSKATAEKLDWNNHENKPYLFNQRITLPLIQDRRGRQIIPKDYFINKNLEYLKGGDSSRCYSTSVTKTKAASYDLKWIKDMVYDLRIIAVTRLKIKRKYDYSYLEEIKVRRDDQQIYTFKEGDFPRLRIQDIKEMLLLLTQRRLPNLIVDKRYDLNVAVHMFTRCIVIQRRVKDLQLGVESYQKKLNLTKPDTYRSYL
nr:hypothetical protein [Tanacetum cinerariifolium]